MIKAITASGKIDRSGQLSLDYPIEGTPPKPVRVIILFDETDGEVNKFWQQVSNYQQQPLLSAKQLQEGLKQALTESGYDSREKIIELVQEIKQEIAQGKHRLIADS
ncbi:hypothetical protein [Moorena producens]|uniref:hypothetical protein n=1 Tax=Moorena producens TaxID=1155739 RepID=UPI003C78526D